MKRVRWPDKRLAKRAARGDEDACAEVVRSHYASIVRFAFHLCGDWQLAEDITQETFAAAWRRIGTFEGRCTLATWLHRIARNKLVDWRRRLRPADVVHDAANSEATFEADPLHALVADEDTQRLHEAVAGLEPDAREVIVLHYFQGLSYREMAAVLDKRAGTMKWLTSRALKTLRTTMNREVGHA